MPATFNSAQYLEQAESRANPSRLASKNIASGDVQFANIPHTLTTEATGDRINLMELPGGAIPMPMLSKVIASASPSDSFVMDIGTLADPNGFADAVDIGGGGAAKVFTAGAAAPAWITQTPVVPDAAGGNAILYATLSAVDAGTLVPGVVLHFQIAWKIGR